MVGMLVLANPLLHQSVGWQLSRTGKASMAASALEQALIARFGTLGER